MKTRAMCNNVPIHVVVCLTVLGLAGSPIPVLAGEQKARTSKSVTTTSKKAAPQKALITGSNIPYDVSPGEVVIPTHSPVTIIDRQAIDRSGRQTLAGVLTRLPPVR